MVIKELFEMTNGEHESSGKFSISSVGGCKRKKFLELCGKYREKYDAKALRAFELGALFHKSAVKEIMEKGHKIGIEVASAEVNIPDSPIISGRADLILSNVKTGELMVADVKSSSDYTLKEVAEGRVPENYIWQVQLYLHFFKLKRGFLLFYGKHRGAVEEYEIIYDKTLCESLIKDIEDFMKDVVAGVEPAPCTESKFGCKCCNTKGEWNNAA